MSELTDSCYNISVADVFNSLRKMTIPVNCENCNSEMADTINYSTTEQFTGKYWIDGKKIYKKTLVLLGSINKNRYQTTRHNIANIDKIISVDTIHNQHKSCANYTGLASKIPHMDFEDDGQNVTNFTVWNCYVDYQNAAIGQTEKNIGTNEHVIYMTVQYTCSDR